MGRQQQGRIGSDDAVNHDVGRARVGFRHFDAGVDHDFSAAPTTTSAGPASSSATSTQTAPATTTITVPGELRGTAADFCSAIMEGSVRISAGAGTQIASAYIIINEWVADLIRFAPASLGAHVDGLTTGLIEISKNLQLGNIATNADFKAAILAVLTTPDAQAIGSYSKANCPPA